MGLFGIYVTIKALWGMTFSNDPEDIKTQQEIESWGKRVDLTLKGIPYEVVYTEEPKKPRHTFLDYILLAVKIVLLYFLVIGIELVWSWLKSN